MPLEVLQALGPEPLRGRLPVGRLALLLGHGGKPGAAAAGASAAAAAAAAARVASARWAGHLQHGLQDAASGVDEPVVHLQQGQVGLPGDLALLVLRRVGMLKQ